MFTTAATARLALALKSGLVSGWRQESFAKLVDQTLERHFKAIKTLTSNGTYFFDYGNAFMKAVYDSGIKEISKNGFDDKDGFIWPSYVEDIMGPMLFDYGYGPFRWVCLSGKHEDLVATTMQLWKWLILTTATKTATTTTGSAMQKKNQLVVGTPGSDSLPRLYGTRQYALKFNELVREGKIGPVMIGRDHHDVSGTDSPFRETSNIKMDLMLLATWPCNVMLVMQLAVWVW